MLQAYSAFSRAADPAVAAREIGERLAAGISAEGLSRIAFFFASARYESMLDQVSQEIESRAGIDAVIGCSAASVVPDQGTPGGGDVDAGISALALTGDLEVERFFLRGLRGRSQSFGHEIGRRTAQMGSSQKTIVLLADSYNLAPDELLGAIEETAGAVPVLGAGATESGMTGVTKVAARGESAANAVAGLVLGGLSVEAIRSPVPTPIGTWWTVTDAEANRILTLDGRPALEEIITSLPASWQSDPAESLARVHIALVPEGDTADPLLRPIVGVNPDRSALLVGDEVLPGTRLALAAADPVGARRRLEAASEGLGALGGVAAVLYFRSDLASGAGYGLPGVDVAYLRRAVGDTPLAGFSSYVTFAPRAGRNRFHHASGLLAGLAPARAIR